MVSHLGSPNLRCLAGSAKSLRAVRAVARVATKLRTTLDLYIYTYIYNMDLLATPEFETKWILHIVGISSPVSPSSCGIPIAESLNHEKHNGHRPHQMLRSLFCKQPKAALFCHFQGLSWRQHHWASPVCISFSLGCVIFYMVMGQNPGALGSIW